MCLTLGLLCPLTRSITVQLKIEDASRRLRTGDLGIPLNPEDRFESTTYNLTEKFLLLQKIKLQHRQLPVAGGNFWREIQNHFRPAGKVKNQNLQPHTLRSKKIGFKIS